MRCVLYALVASQVLIHISNSSTTQMGIASDRRSQKKVKQKMNVEVSQSIFSQKITSMAEGEELVTVLIGESAADEDAFDAELEKTTLHRFNTLAVLQGVTSEKNGSLVLEEGYINASYAERFAYLKPGGDTTLSCNIVKLQLPTQPNKIVYNWIGRNGLNLEAFPREGGRIKVDNRFQLKIKNAQPEDSDNYFCIVSLEYPDRVVNYTNEIHFKVYVDPDIGLEFPFIFETSSCNIYKNQIKMEEIQKSLCREAPCLYELQMECSTTPWFLKDATYMSKNILQVTATKFPHPLYRPPQCKHDCIMANKFEHIQTNMESLEKTIAEMVNTESLIFLKEETIKRRRVIYVCEAGYELHRENCVPCLPGQYSPVRGGGQCLDCLLDSYQDHAARNTCIPCTTDYGTHNTGAFSSSLCYRKIHIIRLTVPFFIVCGIVLGLLLVCFALLVARYNHKFVVWIYSQTAKRTTSSKPKKAKPASSSTPEPVKIERLLEFVSYASAAQAAYATKRQAKERLVQGSQGAGMPGQQPLRMATQPVPQATLIATSGSKAAQPFTQAPLTVPPSAAMPPTASVPAGVYVAPYAPVSSEVTMPPHASVPPAVAMPLSIPIPPGVIVPSNVKLSSNVPVIPSNKVPPDFSVPSGDAVNSGFPNENMPTPKESSFHKTSSTTNMPIRKQSSFKKAPSNENIPKQPSFHQTPSSANMPTQDPASLHQSLSAVNPPAQKQPSLQQISTGNMPTKKEPSFHTTSSTVKMSTQDQAGSMSKQSLERIHHISSNSNMAVQPPSDPKTESRSIHDTNVNRNAFTYSNQWHGRSEVAMYPPTLHKPLLYFPDTYQTFEPRVSDGLFPNKHKLHSHKMHGATESRNRNVSKNSRARLAPPRTSVTVQQSNQVDTSRSCNRRN